MSGGTPGAQSPDFLPNLIDRILEIGRAHKLNFNAGIEAFQSADIPDWHRPQPNTIHTFWAGSLKAAIDSAVQKYRSAPPPAPSRVRRDYYEPALKAASSLSSHLQNDYNRNLLASAFSSHDEALQFLNQLEKLSSVQTIDEDLASQRRVEAICHDYGIVLADAEPYLLENYGPEALARYQHAIEQMDELDRKPRRDAIRFELACDVLEAIGMPLLFSYNEPEIPRQALSEIVTVVVEAVGTYPGTPKPGEDYFAISVTKEAIEYVAAHNRYMQVSSDYNI